MTSQKLIIDVREPEEFIAGHYKSAVNIPLGNLEDSIAQRTDINPDTEIIVYCRSGGRAGVAANLLQKLGFKNVTNGINQAHITESLSAN